MLAFLFFGTQEIMLLPVIGMLKASPQSLWR